MSRTDDLLEQPCMLPLGMSSKEVGEIVFSGSVGPQRY